MMNDGTNLHVLLVQDYTICHTIIKIKIHSFHLLLVCMFLSVYSTISIVKMDKKLSTRYNIKHVNYILVFDQVFFLYSSSHRRWHIHIYASLFVLYGPTITFWLTIKKRQKKLSKNLLERICTQYTT